MTKTVLVLGAMDTKAREYAFLRDQILQSDNLVPPQDGRQLRLGSTGHGTHDVDLLGFARIIDMDLEHEAIQLRFGQRIGSFLLERVLRR